MDSTPNQNDNFDLRHLTPSQYYRKGWPLVLMIFAPSALILAPIQFDSASGFIFEPISFVLLMLPLSIVLVYLFYAVRRRLGIRIDDSGVERYFKHGGGSVRLAWNEIEKISDGPTMHLYGKGRVVPLNLSIFVNEHSVREFVASRIPDGTLFRDDFATGPNPGPLAKRFIGYSEKYGKSVELTEEL